MVLRLDALEVLGRGCELDLGAVANGQVGEDLLVERVWRSSIRSGILVNAELGPECEDLVRVRVDLRSSAGLPMRVSSITTSIKKGTGDPARFLRRT